MYRSVLLYKNSEFLSVDFLKSFFCIVYGESSLTYFACPADSLPDAEIDEYPCDSECDS